MLERTPTDTQMIGQMAAERPPSANAVIFTTLRAASRIAYRRRYPAPKIAIPSWMPRSVAGPVTRVVRTDRSFATHTTACCNPMAKERSGPDLIVRMVRNAPSGRRVTGQSAGPRLRSGQRSHVVVFIVASKRCSVCIEVLLSSSTPTSSG